MAFQTYRSIDTLETTVRYSEQLAVIEKQFMEEILHKLADKFIAENYERIIQGIDIALVQGTVTNIIQKNIQDVLDREYRGKSDIERQSTLRLMHGCCPECGENWKNNTDIDKHQPFYPEFSSVLMDRGVNTTTGHKKNCSLQSVVTK